MHLHAQRGFSLYHCIHRVDFNSRSLGCYYNNAQESYTSASNLFFFPQLKNTSVIKWLGSLNIWIVCSYNFPLPLPRSVQVGVLSLGFSDEWWPIYIFSLKKKKNRNLWIIQWVGKRAPPTFLKLGKIILYNFKGFFFNFF